MSAFDHLREIAPHQLFPGFLARTIHGEELTLAVVEIDPESALPEHHHANEQFGLVISGSIVFRVGDEERELEPGSTWQIPANTPHSARAGAAGAVVLDVFAPPRADWRAMKPGEPSVPRWP